MSERKRRSRRGSRAVTESPLSAQWRPAYRERAVLAGWSTRGDADNLAALADTAGAEVIGRVVQRRSEPDPSTFIGRGKLGEIHGMVHGGGAGLVVFDDELTPGQLRNVEERLGVKVVDRTALILDIFAKRAVTHEGRLQVELAQLE